MLKKIKEVKKIEGMARRFLFSSNHTPFKLAIDNNEINLHYYLFLGLMQLLRL